MTTLVRHRYFDLSSSEVREVQLDEYLLALTGRYAVAKITIQDEDIQIAITPPAKHWLHSLDVLQAMEELL
jgi:hypothetical protein